MATFIRQASLPVFITCLVLLGGAAIVHLATAEPAPVIHVRWRPDVSDVDRAIAERQLLLANPEGTDARTFAYSVMDFSDANIRAIVTHPLIEDTHEIDRGAFRLQPTAPLGQETRWLAHDLPLLRDDGTRRAILWLLIGLLIVSGAGVWTTRRQATSQRMS